MTIRYRKTRKGANTLTARHKDEHDTNYDDDIVDFNEEDVVRLRGRMKGTYPGAIREHCQGACGGDARSPMRKYALAVWHYVIQKSKGKARSDDEHRSILVPSTKGGGRGADGKGIKAEHGRVLYLECNMHRCW